MSGHSKWSTIKHKKAKTDATRGRIFTRLIKEITVASRMGGGDETANPRLRLALDKARANNMPKDTVERAIKRGTGELEGVTYEELTYEAYGPAGVALIIDLITDNRNRTAAEIRSMFTKHGGNLGQTGSVSFMFDRKGVLLFDAAATTEDRVMEVALEGGADDVSSEDGAIVVKCDPADFPNVTKAFEDAGLKPESAEVTLIPQTPVDLSEEDLEKVQKLLGVIEDHDDVQRVYTNANLPDDEDD